MSLFSLDPTEFAGKRVLVTGGTQGMGEAIAKLRGLVGFYVAEHNTHLPHSAFAGQTPDEMYFGTGDDVPAQLAAARKAARERRLEENRAQACPACARTAPDDSAAA